MLIKTDVQQLPDGYLDRTPMFQYILLSICFPMWGITASLNDILITQFKSIFTLSDFASAFVQSAFYGGYFLLAIPASRVIRRWSYKLSILIGLSCYIGGCMLFFPASHMATYSVFLVALFAIAVGLSFLETSCNTYSSMIGPKDKATLRLNISQTFYPIGSIFGILLGKYLIFTEGEALHKQMGALAGDEQRQFAEAMLQRTLQAYQFNESKATIGETLRYLAGNGRFKAGIVAQFLYVGMQTAVWSFTIRLALQLDPALNERVASNYMIRAFIGFFVGKFIANILMTKFNENKVLIVYSILGVLALLYVINVHNMSAVWAAILLPHYSAPAGRPFTRARSIPSKTNAIPKPAARSSSCPLLAARSFR